MTICFPGPSVESNSEIACDPGAIYACSQDVRFVNFCICAYSIKTKKKASIRYAFIGLFCFIVFGCLSGLASIQQPHLVLASKTH